MLFCGLEISAGSVLVLYFTWGLFRIFFMGITWVLLPLLKSFLRSTGVFSSLVCCTFRLLLGVSAFGCVLAGVDGALFVFKGLILTRVSLWRFGRRLILWGLFSTGDAGRSERNFLRGVRFMLGAASACFLLEGVETSWRQQIPS